MFVSNLLVIAGLDPILSLNGFGVNDLFLRGDVIGEFKKSLGKNLNLSIQISNSLFNVLVGLFKASPLFMD